ncbi:MAG: helix-turn-helix domain-containing protein [Myxococcota bacterium]|nr:helix-turn-helix domain-containing protein [Myxococcota bacterium]
MAAAIVPQFGWPPYLVTKFAAAYTGKSRWGIYRAVQAGEIAPVGKRGRELVFAREDLDRYMLGPGAAAAADSKPERCGTLRGNGSTTASALDRLKLLRGGAK